MATFKGKSTRPKHKPVIEDWIELPREIMSKHAEVELCMDIMFINGVKLMTAIDRTIRFRSVVPVQSRESRHFMKLGGVYLATDRPKAMDRRKVGSL